MTQDSERFWFPAKRHGWGWGPPTRWQGWAVLVCYASLLGLSAAVFLRTDDIAGFLGCAIAATIVLVFICWLKGERPRWRWGEK